MVRAQLRIMATERWEYRLAELADFSSKEMKNKVDYIWGLHVSQYSGSHRLYGVSFEGAWSSHLTNTPFVISPVPNGWASGFHFVFEYQYSGWLFQTGVGMNWQQVYTNISDTSIYHYQMHDTWEHVEDAEFVLKHDFMHRQDLSRNLYVQIPLYAGHYIIGPKGVGYGLAGFQLNYSFFGNTRQRLEGSSMAVYEPFLGLWREMDNHGYRKDVPIVRTGERLRLKFDIMAHAEIGYEYTTFRGPHNYRKTRTSGQDWRFRFAAFADYGLFNICPQTNNVLYDTPLETIYDFPTYRKVCSSLIPCIPSVLPGSYAFYPAIHHRLQSPCQTRQAILLTCFPNHNQSGSTR